MSFSRFDLFFLIMSASPPSVVFGSTFACAFAMAVPARSATPVITARRPSSAFVEEPFEERLVKCKAS